MPDARLARARRSLPAGYQFGDARPRIAIRFLRQWDAHTEYAESVRRARAALMVAPLRDWSPVMEAARQGQHPPVFDTFMAPNIVTEHPCGCYMRGGDHLTRCLQHARKLTDWNVIEGEHDVPQSPLSTPPPGLDD